MKTAICFYGIVGGTDGKDGAGTVIPFEECYKTYKKHIIDINNADVFIHTWSTEVEKGVVDLYKPKKHKFQKQIRFSASKNTHRSLSRWHSTKEVLELKKAYERENNFKYDCVMLLRFDVQWFVDVDFSKYDLNHLHASNWNRPDRNPRHKNYKELPSTKTNNSLKVNGFSDLWFFSNSKIMDEFASVYGGVKAGRYKYSQHYSAWDHFCQHGYSREDFRFVFYRFFDFELYRFYVLRNFWKKGDGKL